VILDAEGPGASLGQVLRAGQHFHNLHQHLKTNQGFSVADPDPGSGAFLTPGSGMGKKSRSGSRMNIPEHTAESLETIFW